MSGETNEITIGSNVIVKVGKNEIPATLLEIGHECYLVKSVTSGKEFTVRYIRSAAETETEETEEKETPNPAPESATIPKPEKRMSLLDAAVEVLRNSDHPMNTRELVKAATDAGFWIPTGCKTPEQTLYGSIFREIAMKELPRIRKSEQKGKFEFAG